MHTFPSDFLIRDQLHTKVVSPPSRKVSFSDNFFSDSIFQNPYTGVSLLYLAIQATKIKFLFILVHTHQVFP